MSSLTIAEALNRALREAMWEDERVFILGEEITNWGAGGGLFGVTKGLLSDFGPNRVRDVPLSEGAVVYAAIGAALTGWRPVVDINFSDFLLLAMSPLINAAAKYRYIFNGQYQVPLVIRANTGVAGGKGAQHSQSLETIFAHVPGLEVVLPATANDAYWLLKEAILSPNPTIFLEHKALYTNAGQLSDEPVGLGSARIVRRGTDATVVASHLMLHRSLAVAERLACDGIDIEVLDIRSLFPLDMKTIFDSVKRTRRALVCHEAPLMFGFGGEIAAAISEHLWHELAAPVRRIGGSRTPIPFSPRLEAEVVPSEGLIESTVRAMLAGQ